jgi:hypothetical protein
MVIERVYRGCEETTMRARRSTGDGWESHGTRDMFEEKNR